MTFEEEFEEILLVFFKNSVNYMVVGGYAVNFHGYERTTSDMDIWVEPTSENLLKISAAVKELGFDDESIDHINKFDPQTPYLFHLGTKPTDIEVFNFVTGVKYQDAEPHKIKFNYSSSYPVYFISINDLILNKMLTNRSQDKLDVEMLQKIQKLK